RADRVLTVHKDAVTTRGNGKFVVVINANKAKPTKVELGDAVGDRFTVTSGLKQGDIVVVRGNETLRPGQKVTFDEPSG
ncbi:MAG: efflux RND transporter periplasmic adaptor subunit, partial [Pseudomonadota bacterium]|nr:efflux RND transporter periplasmic adaptor subunit [Pseudomonadota bacterium]